MPKPPMTATDASQVLRGGREMTTPDDQVTVEECLQAGRILLAERDRLIVVAISAQRLLEAADDETAARARRRLADALARWT